MRKIILTCLFFEMFLHSSCTSTDKNKQTNKEDNIAVENGLIPSNTASLMEIKEYVLWIQDTENGFKKEKKIDDLTFSVQYKPYEYIICEEERKEELPDTLLKNKILEINNMQYYDFKISVNEGAGELLKHQLSSSQEYEKRVNYFSFMMQNDIQLVEDKDTLPCALFHFERTYGASPSSIFLLGFPVSKNKTAVEKTLLIYDRTFNKGLLKFTFTRKDLRNLPKIKTHEY